MNWIILTFLGITWGLSFTISKIAAKAGGTPIGLTFWQSIISATLLFIFITWKHGKFRLEKSLYKFILIVSLLAGVFPNIIWYAAAYHVDAGILAISVSVIPLFTYLIALALKLDVFNTTKVVGLILGFIALLILVIPENSLPDRKDVPWVLLSLICSLCYAIENIYIDKIKPERFGPIQIACAIAIVSSFFTLPLAVVTDQFFVPSLYNKPLLFSVISLSLITASCYAIFIFLIGRAGSVFASQVGYIVTFFGVLWGIILLNEAHSSFVWISLIFIVIGVFLVQPRDNIEKTENK